MKRRQHLPLYGVGPAIAAFQVILTAAGIILTCRGSFNGDRIDALNVPLKIVGIALIAFGVYLNDSAKRKSKLFERVAENRLITTGVYGIVRNPVYSAVLLACTGAICLFNHLILFVIPVVCWRVTTAVLMRTEEKWLAELHGQAYIEYCRRVNRCIPWFPRRQ